MIDTNEYETTIRPALAKFCGWEQESSGVWKAPTLPGEFDYWSPMPADPLHNPGDAWELHKALLESSAVWDFIWLTPRHRMYGNRLAVNHNHYKGETPEEALVLAAWEVVRTTTLTGERVKGIAEGD